MALRVAGAAFLVALALAAAALAVPAWRSALAERLPPQWRIALVAWRDRIAVDHGIEIAMPDGVRLRASLYRPRDAQGPLPTVLIRLPYDRLRYAGGYRWALFFARHGYAVLVQDLRGTGASGGELLPWREAGTDGWATLDWIQAQPWSTGKVGTFGCSALGETQWVLARRPHPAHKAMIPSGAGGAIGAAAGRHAYFGVFEGGVFQLASGFGWFVNHGAKDPAAPPAAPFDLARHLRTLPVSGLVRAVRPAPNGYSDFLATPLGDPAWEGWGYLGAEDRPGVPALVINTWGDQTAGDTLALASAWQQAAGAAGQKVLIGPGDHCGHGGWSEARSSFGELPVENAAFPLEERYLRWFGHHLRGEGESPASLPAFTYFMLVENRWHTAQAWPPEQARTERWYLSSAGRANSSRGDGLLSPAPAAGATADAFDYDPAEPVPTRGGPVCCTGDAHEKPGPRDQADVESRADVLVYTSAPLARDLRIAGPLRARLAVSTSAPDTDFVVRLAHVRPDGKSTGIQEGALRLRYRDGFAAPRLAEPGRRYDITVDLRSIAYRVPRGHRLRLHVTSSSFPRLERNLNTGAANNADEVRAVVATNRVHHDAAGASWVELPLLPDEAP